MPSDSTSYERDDDMRYLMIRRRVTAMALGLLGAAALFAALAHL
jgi:hypothetical protein